MPQDVELLTIPGKWEITYNYAAGSVASRFLMEIRDNKRLLGTKCPKCNRVLMPPRSFCERCFVKLGDEWVQVGPNGKITAFTIVYEAFKGLPPPPYIIALAQLDRADTSLLNFIVLERPEEIDRVSQKVDIGTGVEVVFKDERAGRITDFYYRLTI